MAWYSYSGSWQQIEIETNTWLWPRVLRHPSWRSSSARFSTSPRLSGWARTAWRCWPRAGRDWSWRPHRGRPASGWRGGRCPRFAEFDGQVIRQWLVKGDSESPDQYHVANEDGARDRAWELEHRQRDEAADDGHFEHARVNLRNRDQVTVEPVEPQRREKSWQRSRRKAAGSQRRLWNSRPGHGRRGGRGPGNRSRASTSAGRPGRTMIWHKPNGTRPMLRIEVRPAELARGGAVQRRGKCAASTDGYLLGARALCCTVPPLTVIISIHGTVYSKEQGAQSRARRSRSSAGWPAHEAEARLR